jgi:hypothetical protein
LYIAKVLYEDQKEKEKSPAKKAAKANRLGIS